MELASRGLGTTGPEIGMRIRRFVVANGGGLDLCRSRIPGLLMNGSCRVNVHLCTYVSILSAHSTAHEYFTRLRKLRRTFYTNDRVREKLQRSEDLSI